MMPFKHVYFFVGGSADGSRVDRELLGGKGADLAEMARLGVNVPPGFTITTSACHAFLAHNAVPDHIRAEVRAALNHLEEMCGKRLGDEDKPLLVSVRSGAAVSMPGMMDTVLNLGCNREVVAALSRNGNERFALDVYRRLIQMFTDVVQGLKLEEFEDILDEAVAATGVANDALLPASALEGVVERFLALYEGAVGEPFPESPVEQIERAVEAVFSSWNAPRARTYRALHGVPNDLGTAANVQSMVFGNLNDRSGSGVAFTRDPATGAAELYGEWLRQAEGEDVVGGVRTPVPIAAASGNAGSLETLLPEAFDELQEIAARLEEHYADMLDLEFTVEDGTLYMLQTRRGKRTAAAAVKIAVDLVQEGRLSRSTALGRVEPDALDQLLHPRVSENHGGELITRGAPASPGAAIGTIVFSAQQAEERAAAGEDVILVRPMTVADDVGGMAAARGVLTARGGMTSHAAVVARGMGKPCITGASALQIDLANGSFRVGDRTFAAGDKISIDGGTGSVYAGAVELVEPEVSGAFSTLMGWADEARQLGVRANADTPEDARRARSLGAQGIGLCRTEHMFFGADRLPFVQTAILATSDASRDDAIARLETMQREDFVEILRAMDGLPVTIRLLDPPLHEFLPDEPHEVAALAGRLGRDAGELDRHIDALRGENPMLGHRGCRLGITRPALYRMQVRAIAAAAREVAGGGGHPLPEIMVPLVADAAELRWIFENVIKPSMRQVDPDLSYPVGAMIETPRACIDAGAIAETAQFFSFGTNDLTQMTYGFSRDDSQEFLSVYAELGIMPTDPFQHLDASGVGVLVEAALRRGLEARERLSTGVCGEHGGDPQSIDFWQRVGIDYVSCSPFRVPAARLSAAQAAIEHPREG
jgi:pyruvate,orthophosphate dikinase